MISNRTDVEELRAILENFHNPETLNEHPWVSRPFVTGFIAENQGFQNENPGLQLVHAVAELFSRMMPSTSPRHGKRLDTRWGEFGILAAQYFAPLKFGAPIPSSLRDAWGRIDESILLYVFGDEAASLTTEQIAFYKLVGDEPEVAPPSTLSDWHRKGIQRLAETISAREQYLAKQSSGIPAESAGEKTSPGSRRRSPVWKAIRAAMLILLLLVLAALVWGGLKAKRVYDQALVVWDDANRIRDLASSSPNMETIKEVGPLLSTLRQDFGTLKAETEPYLWLGPRLGWVPVYGGDLASAQDLVTLADSVLSSADIAYRAGLPLLDAVNNTSGQSHLDPSAISKLALEAQPQWIEAQRELDKAVAARERLDVDRLSPRLRELIVENVDPLIPLMQDGLTLALEFPRLMGATSEGPKTYLLLAQNEDELRPTGGFITAAATLLIQDGQISSLRFQNSGDLDNWERPYPAAPWQLQQYMNSPVLIFRDANWFTDFRTAALYAEYLYSYTNEHSVDGVIAFDQQMLVMVLKATGPIEVEDAPYPIDANNVIAYMRSAKTPTAEDLASPDWNYKIFINRIVAALITRMFSGDISWEQLSATLVEGMNERHLVLQLDDSMLTSFLASHQWDGAVRPGNSDFLMVVDSNVGFNKTNAVVKTNLSYDVDLTDPTAPTGQLVVTHQNNAAKDVPCIHRNTSEEIPGEEDYPINRCYWDYLRVYTLADTELLGAAVQTVPSEWMILQRTVPPQVDILEEKIEGVRGFGTLKVVPGGQSLATNFRFSLPAGVVEVQPGSGLMVYRLKIQKQPGTLGVPITIRIHLPNSASVQKAPSGAVVQDQNILFETALTTDVEVEVDFLVP